MQPVTRPPKCGPKPGSRGGRSYEGLEHDERAAFSAYIQGLRLSAGISQGDLALEADVEARVIPYFEEHPREPMRSTRRRNQLGAICRALARLLDEDGAVMLAEVNRLGGGVA